VERKACGRHYGARSQPRAVKHVMGEQSQEIFLDEMRSVESTKTCWASNGSVQAR
jgi:hypothetical protein